LRAIEDQGDKQVYLPADQDVRYGIVMKTIAEIKQTASKNWAW
jgi:biopolymer transport protein ExbD